MSTAFLYLLNAASHRNLLVIDLDFLGVDPIVIDEPIVTVGSTYFAASIIDSSRNSPRPTVVFFAIAVQSGFDKGRMPGVFWNSFHPPRSQWARMISCVFAVIRAMGSLMSS